MDNLTDTVQSVTNMSDEDAAKVTEAIEWIRPITSEERAGLLEILREDSHSAQRALQAAYYKQQEAITEQVELEFADEVDHVQEIEDEIAALHEKFGKDLKKLRKKAEKNQVQIETYSGQKTFGDSSCHADNWHVYDTSKKVSRKSKALRERMKPIEAAMSAASVHLAEVEAKASRGIRLAAVTKDASALLDTLPSAEKMIEGMIAAAATATQELEARKS